MLYLEDYLELIEHLPQELRDRLTYIRESDLKVNNSSLQLEGKVKKFFAEAKNFNQEQRQCEYEEIQTEFQKTIKYSDDKVNIASQTHDIMIKLIQKLDTELEKFKLELEADHAGITEELERRSLELDADSQLDELINGHLNGEHNQSRLSIASTSSHHQNRVPSSSSTIKDRRRSEHKNHRHHPYRNNHDNGYRGHHHEYKITSKNSSQYPRQIGSKFVQQQLHQQSRQNSRTSSPLPLGVNMSSSSSVAGDNNDSGIVGGHYNNNIASFGFKSSNTNTKSNSPFNHQHSALSAALSSATPTAPPFSTFAMVNNATVQNNKISKQQTGSKANNIIDSNDPLVRQNPLAAAASQAIAATQQLQQGRRTLSLKASFAAINAAGLASSPIDPLGHTNKHDANRNALAPMPPDQQAFRFNQYGRMDGQQSDQSPLYISVTKSGRHTKRPKHRSSHLYPDESPTSISSDNSVFENSESLSSADFIESGTNFGSTSPSSLDFNGTANQANATLYQKDETKYCHCRQISYGDMVACDNDECEIEWFHYGCVGITQEPKGTWYCPDCRPLMSNQQNGQRASAKETW